MNYLTWKKKSFSKTNLTQTNLVKFLWEFQHGCKSFFVLEKNVNLFQTLNLHSVNGRIGNGGMLKRNIVDVKSFISEIVISTHFSS